MRKYTLIPLQDPVASIDSNETHGNRCHCQSHPTPGCTLRFTRARGEEKRKVLSFRVHRSQAISYYEKVSGSLARLLEFKRVHDNDTDDLQNEQAPSSADVLFLTAAREREDKYINSRSM